MEQQNNNQQDSHNQPPYGNYNPPQYGDYNQPPQGNLNQFVNPAGKGMAIASLVLGILSIVDPTFFLGIALGIVGIILAVVSKKKGFSGGIRTAGFVLSIIGLAVNALFIIAVLALGQALMSIGLDSFFSDWHF